MAREKKPPKHTIGDLYQMQSLSLNSKVRMTQDRIDGWIDEYGEDGVYVSFSGGKDSTVLLDIVRKRHPDVVAVFADTGLEFPEIRQFVRTFENVRIVRPKMNFRQVIEKYGYPFISKEVSECVYGTKRFLANNADYKNEYMKLFGLGRFAKSGGAAGQQGTASGNAVQGETPVRNSNSEEPVRGGNKSDYSQFNCERYKFFLEDGAPPISNLCCKVMKKSPMHSYERETGQKRMTAQMASESRLRTQKWLENGCNGFDMKTPVSNPMAFWTEQDVLLYIKEHQLPMCSVYGEIVEDYGAQGQVENQMDMGDLGIFDMGRKPLKTTGCDRTGCVFCGYGIHLEKESRFERLAVTHPKLCDYVMRGGAFDENGIWKPDDRGLGYWYCIEWINAHGKMRIPIPNMEHYLETYMTEEARKYIYG